MGCRVLELHLVDGDLTKTKQDAFITYDYMDKIGKVYRDRFEVIPETVGQFTGLRDKNGKDIYEGDILKAWKHNETPFIGEVNHRSGVLWFKNWHWIEFQNIFRSIEIICTIYNKQEDSDA